VIAGLKADNSPYLMSSDIIGAQCFKDDFVVAGDTAETLFGMCESVYRCVNGLRAHAQPPEALPCVAAPVCRCRLAGRVHRWAGAANPARAAAAPSHERAPNPRLLVRALRRPDLEPDDLFEVLSQCLLSGVDRDCLAGWGATVYIM
jgi:20S proteasome alpha/beta subunit